MKLSDIKIPEAYGDAIKNILDLYDYIETFDDYAMLQTAVNFMIENRYGVDAACRVNEILRAVEKEKRKNA